MLLLRLSLALALLAGCAAPRPEPPKAAAPSLPAGALKSTDADAAACLSQGHPVGTDDYARCVLRLAEQRRAGGAAEEALTPDMPVKVGDWCYAMTSPDPFLCFDI